MIAELICVGTELLMGQITNTDAQYIASALAPAGIDLYHQTVVGDNPDRLLESIRTALSRSDIVILTGGLGPTDDDLTKETAAIAFDVPLILYPEEWDRIVSFFKKSGRIPALNNQKQAMFPPDCRILPNPNGTAPGCIIEKNGKTAVLLPGPPRELIPMFRDHVLPFLQSRTDHLLCSQTLRIFGIGESSVASMLDDLIRAQTNPTIATYALTGEVTIRITARCKSEEEGKDLIFPILRIIRERLGDFIFSECNESLPVVCHNALLKRKETVAAAESCTGGLLSSAFVDLSGSSEYFLEGAVTYSNEAKMRRLGVLPETIETVGPVSEKCAYEMANGIRKTSGSTYGLATTGIAGPGGGTSQNPVGSVYIAIADGHETIVRHLQLCGDRSTIRQITVLNILDLLRRKLCT